MAIVGLVTVAAIHWAQVVPTMKDSPYLGTAFLLLTLACIGLAFWLLVSDRGLAWILVAGVNGLTIAGYIFTRTVSSFLDSQDVGNWSESLAMVALLVESLLVLLTLYRLIGEGREQTTPNYQRVAPSVDVRSPGLPAYEMQRTPRPGR
ncbi:MAG TPA: hypothetical protein VFZ97_12675 [Acidimicrobiales bacterium]